jgi:membrane-bound lytic murein transglycosylase D
MIIAKNPEKHGFGHVEPDPSLQYEVVKVDTAIDLRLVAEITDTPYETIEDLNPELKRGVTPPDMKYGLRLPVGMQDQFVAVLDRIPEDQRDSWRVLHTKSGDTLAALAELHGVSAEQLAQLNRLESAVALESGIPLVIPSDIARSPIRGRISDVRDVSPQLARRSTNRITITVRPGDTLSRVAARYGLSVRDVARLNKLSVKSQLRTGQKLTLNVPANRRQPPPTATVKPRSALEAPTSYRVQRGDTLASIAARHGVSVSDLRRWNNLRSDKIAAGQQLVVKPESVKVKPASAQKISYHVRRGDTLSSIAARYGVSTSDLKNWNRLRSNTIAIGQRLTIYR